MGILAKFGCLLILFGIVKLAIYFYQKGKKMNLKQIRAQEGLTVQQFSRCSRIA